MEFKLERQQLVDKLKVCVDVAGNPNTAFRLDLHTGSFHVVDVSRNLGVAGKLREDESAEQEIILPVKLLASLIPQLTDKEVLFKLDEDSNEVELGGGRSKYNLRALALAPDFPEADDFGKVFAELSGKQLLAALENVIYAVSKKDARPVLTGISFRKTATNSGHALELCATDAYRLAVSSVDESSGVDGDDQVIVPQDSLQILMKIIKQDPEVGVVLSLDENGGRARCQVGEWTIITRLLQGTYPPYEKLFPADEQITYEVELDVAELQAALKMAKPLVPAINDEVQISLVEEPLLFVENQELGRVEEKLEKVVPVDGAWPGFTIKIRFPHLVEALGAATTKKVVLRLQSADKALLLNSDAVRSLIMPV